MSGNVMLATSINRHRKPSSAEPARSDSSAMSRQNGLESEGELNDRHPVSHVHLRLMHDDRCMERDPLIKVHDVLVHETHAAG